jgi:hypothetical protein
MSYLVSRLKAEVMFQLIVVPSLEASPGTEAVQSTGGFSFQGPPVVAVASFQNPVIGHARICWPWKVPGGSDFSVRTTGDVRELTYRTAAIAWLFPPAPATHMSPEGTV